MISIDSNIFTYLINATAVGYNPNCDYSNLANEKIAVLRIFLYDGNFCILPVVRKEYGDISNLDIRNMHDSFSIKLIYEINFIDKKKYKLAYKAAFKYHKDEKDCKVVAEIYGSGINTLLTFDKKFINKLNNIMGVHIMRPSVLWEKLNFKKGSPPKWQPHKTNPLSRNKFWRW